MPEISNFVIPAMQFFSAGFFESQDGKYYRYNRPEHVKEIFENFLKLKYPLLQIQNLILMQRGDIQKSFYLKPKKEAVNLIHRDALYTESRPLYQIKLFKILRRKFIQE